MSIAWSTVVVVVLLLPGFAFFVGFYLPKNVTQEAAPISALGQLAGLVGFAFFAHVAFYGVINSWLCHGDSAMVPCVAVDKFIPLLRADTNTATDTVSKDPAAIREMLDAHVLWVLLYFFAISLSGLGVGSLAGVLVERGFLRSLARNRWLYDLLEVTRNPTLGFVSAYVLSKTSHDERCIMYHGIVHGLYLKANGTINHLLLKDAQTSVLEVTQTAPQHHIAHAVALATNPTEPMQFLLLTSDEIANVYFEKTAQFKEEEDDRTQTVKAYLEDLAEEASKDPSG